MKCFEIGSLLVRHSCYSPCLQIECLEVHGVLRLSGENVYDGCGTSFDSRKVVAVYHHDAETGVRHDFVGIAAGFTTDLARRNHDDGVAVQEMGKANFLGNIVE